METLIVQPETRSKMVALKAFLSALNIDFKTAGKDKAGSVITNEETIKRIEVYEQKRIVPEVHNLDEIKRLMKV